MPAIIVENDESQWKDETGEIYHFPKRYLPILTPGQRVIYYKSRLRNPDYAAQRLSADPHYFGIAEIGQVPHLQVFASLPNRIVYSDLNGKA
jgi:5-methylcytosine-specific restriction protein A